MKQEEEQKDMSAYFRRTMDAMPCLVFVKDSAGRFVDGNEAFVKYMGVSSLSEIVGLTDYNFYDKELIHVLMKRFNLNAETIEQIKGEKKSWLSDFIRFVSPMPAASAIA